MLDKTVDQIQLYEAERKYGDNGVVKAWRVVGRDSAGRPVFESAGSPGDPDRGPAQGSTNQQAVTKWLAGIPVNEPGFPPTGPRDHDGKPTDRAEIEILTSKGWLNAATGEPTDVTENAQ